MEPLLPPGKLPPALLGRLLSLLPTDDPSLLLGPTLGEDAALIEFDPGATSILVAKVDPITFATDEIGYYAVNVCANDIAVAGGTPAYYLPTLLLPAHHASADMAEPIFAQIAAACRALHIVVAGGHSEVTHAVRQPVIAGAMLGRAARNRLISSGGARPGDALLLVGQIPVEGASILAREQRDTLLGRGWRADELDAAAAFLHDPGISVLAPARLAAQSGYVSAMHDPTEGGIVTALRELATASGTGLSVALDAIPVPELARRLCAEFGIDPLGAIASGALLAAAPADLAAPLMDLWHSAGFLASRIGTCLPLEEGLIAWQGNTQVPFPQFSADELTRLWKE